MLDNLLNSTNLIIDQTKMHLVLLAKIISVPWLIYLLNLILGKRLYYLGIIPRHTYGLLGIFFAPLLHANINHLFFNSIPLLVLSNFLLITGFDYFLTATFFITITSGLFIWCFAKPGIHIGASGLITGFWGLLVCDIVQQGSLTAVILGIISLYYFAGIFLSIFPGKKGISWEGHFFGLVAGIAASDVLPIYYSNSW